MLSRLVDESTIVYIVLILVCSGLLFAWRRTRRWGFLAGTAACLLLVIAFAILTQVYVTDLKKIENLIRVAADAVVRKDADTIQHQLAHNFQYHRADMKTFMKAASEAMERGDAKEVLVWDFVKESMESEKGTARVSFMAKPKGNWSEGVHYRVVSDLVREGDGQWRIQTFAIFKPFADTKDEQVIPGF